MGSIGFNSNSQLQVNGTPFQTGFKNYIINGNFDVWQRGTTWTLVAGNSGYLADRFFTGVAAGATGNIEVSDSSIVDGNKIYNAARFNSTLQGSESNFAWLQPIENYWELWGRTFTISFKYKTNVTHTRNLYGIWRNGSQSSIGQVIAGQKSVTLVGDGNVHTITFTIDASAIAPVSPITCFIVALTHGTDLANDTYFTDIQLEMGSIATPFENRPYGLELSLCQRYYEVGVVAGTFRKWSGSSVAGYELIRLRFNTLKRVSPTIATSNIVYTTGCSSLSVNANAELLAASVTASTAGAIYSAEFDWTASAEL